uniref:Uncharacterized protein n=1 Tax=Strongyloides venezuelensis TaxID=75913 RepID=A0A0K0FFZ6_STRVS
MPLSASIILDYIVVVIEKVNTLPYNWRRSKTVTKEESSFDVESNQRSDLGRICGESSDDSGGVPID